MEATKARTPRPATTGNGFTHLVLHLKIATRIARDVEAILKTSGAVSEQCSVDANAPHQFIILSHDPQINLSQLSQVDLKR